MISQWNIRERYFTIINAACHNNAISNRSEILKHTNLNIRFSTDYITPSLIEWDAMEKEEETGNPERDHPFD
jgi:hypothetical protein